MNQQDAPQGVDYPCQWDYTIIADSGEAAAMAVSAAVAQRPHSRQEPTASRTGRYCSLRISVQVDDENERNAIFAMLRNSDGVRMVM